MDVLLSIIGGSCGAALVTGAVTLVQFLINRRDKHSGKAEMAKIIIIIMATTMAC